MLVVVGATGPVGDVVATAAVETAIVDVAAAVTVGSALDVAADVVVAAVIALGVVGAWMVVRGVVRLRRCESACAHFFGSRHRRSCFLERSRPQQEQQQQQL